jgi:hypothetical protein
MTIAILAALPALRTKLGRKPSADEVFCYLADHDETGVIVDSTTDKLIWEDTKGELHNIARKTSPFNMLPVLCERR